MTKRKKIFLFTSVIISLILLIVGNIYILHIFEPAKITRIDLQPFLEMKIGETKKLEAIFLTSKSKISATKFEKALKLLQPQWKTANGNLVSVSQAGEVTALKSGETKVLLVTTDSTLAAHTVIKISDEEVKMENNQIVGAGEEISEKTSVQQQEETVSDENKKDIQTQNINITNTTKEDPTNESTTKEHCPTCGSTSHIIHPTYIPKCPTCGSTSHTTHPKCPTCGSISHTIHPTASECAAPSPEPTQRKEHCPTCESTEHKICYVCPSCGIVHTS